jgi:prevent-host-death family protein
VPWNLEDAKNQFSRVVREAMAGCPQHVTRSGQPAVVVVSAEEYARLTAPREDLVTFLTRSPLARGRLDLTRSRDTGRDVTP